MILTSIIFIEIFYSNINNVFGLETPEPSASLQPRDYNPHPYYHHNNNNHHRNLYHDYVQQQQQEQQQSSNLINTELYQQNNNNNNNNVVTPSYYIDDNFHLTESETESTTKRPPTEKQIVENGIYSQGPIQFPKNNNEQDDVIKKLPHPYERLSLKSQKLNNGFNGDYNELIRPTIKALSKYAERLLLQKPQYNNNNIDNENENENNNHNNNDHNYVYDEEDEIASSESSSKKHYAFSYRVHDKVSGDDFSHTQQQTNGGAVTGSYKVQLPDGRTQIVRYKADKDGYNAEVSYLDENQQEILTSNNNNHNHNNPIIQNRNQNTLHTQISYKNPPYYPREPEHNQQQSILSSKIPSTSDYYNLVKNGYQSTVAPSPSPPSPFIQNYLPTRTPTNRNYLYQQQYPNTIPISKVDINTYNTAPSSSPPTSLPLPRSSTYLPATSHIYHHISTTTTAAPSSESVLPSPTPPGFASSSYTISRTPSSYANQNYNQLPSYQYSTISSSSIPSSSPAPASSSHLNYNSKLPSNYDYYFDYDNSNADDDEGGALINQDVPGIPGYSSTISPSINTRRLTITNNDNHNNELKTFPKQALYFRIKK